MFIVLGPGKNKGDLTPMCDDCNGKYRKRTDLILTTFPDGVTRWLCPKCKAKQYTRGVGVIVKGYTERGRQ